MDQRISFVTLAVADLETSRRFYLDGLGWTEDVYVEGDVCMIKAGEHVVLSLWQRDKFEAEVGAIASPPGSVAPFTLSHNVASDAEVDDVLATATAAGAHVAEGEQREWGGYSGYFTDPDGVRWEIAWNPQEIGMAVIP